MITVVHVRDGFDTYIGRENRWYRLPRSKWANPYKIPRDVATPQEAVEKYREWIMTQPELLAALPELRDKRLGCYCRGKYPVCHGDVLVELAGAVTDKLSQ